MCGAGSIGCALRCSRSLKVGSWMSPGLPTAGYNAKPQDWRFVHNGNDAKKSSLAELQCVHILTHKALCVRACA